MYIVWWIVVGLIAGWATGRIMRGSGYGPLMDILLGVVGAVLGGWLVSALGFAGAGGMIYTIIVAIIGACLLVAIARALSGRRTAL